MTHVQECWKVAISTPLFVNYSLYTQIVIFQGVIAIEGHGLRQWGMQQEKVWQLITGEPSCDCGWLCVCVCVLVWQACTSNTCHDLLMRWYWLSPVLQVQFVSPFSCSPKCRVATGDIQPPWEQEVSCRGEHSISPPLTLQYRISPQISSHSIEDPKNMHLLYRFTWRNNLVCTAFCHAVSTKGIFCNEFCTIFI